MTPGRTDIRRKLWPVHYNDIHGYYYDAILSLLSKAEGKRFRQWMRGQTMALLADRSVVYVWDFDNWLAGGPVLD